MGNIDLRITSYDQVRKRDSKVLIRRLARFVVLRVERALVENGAHDLVCGLTRSSCTGGNSNYNSNLCRASQGILIPGLDLFYFCLSRFRSATYRALNLDSHVAACGDHRASSGKADD